MPEQAITTDSLAEKQKDDQKIRQSHRWESLCILRALLDFTKRRLLTSSTKKEPRPSESTRTTVALRGAIHSFRPNLIGFRPNTVQQGVISSTLALAFTQIHYSHEGNSNY